ncbi:MAG: hypothetical protein PHQ64_03785 [Bacilli bacterium]|nr:hypothetical protein [Bacilli bacterium]
MKQIESDYNLTNQRILDFREELYNYFAVRYAVLKPEENFISEHFPNINDQRKIIITLNEMIKVNNIFYLVKDKKILINTLNLIKNIRTDNIDKELLEASNELIITINGILTQSESKLVWEQDLCLLLESQTRRIPSDLKPFLHNAVKDFIDSDYMLMEHLIKGRSIEGIYPLNIISSINTILYMYEYTVDLYDKELTDYLSLILEEQKKVIKEGKILIGNFFDRRYQKKILNYYIEDTENNIFEINENKKNYVKKI